MQEAESRRKLEQRLGLLQPPFYMTAEHGPTTNKNVQEDHYNDEICVIDKDYGYNDKVDFEESNFEDIDEIFDDCSDIDYRILPQHHEL
eukprot:428384-Amphidinium_carterae.1